MQSAVESSESSSNQQTQGLSRGSQSQPRRSTRLSQIEISNEDSWGLGKRTSTRLELSVQTESATKFRAKSPTAEDWCLAEQDTQPVIDQLKLDMKAPVVKQPLLDPNFTSVMPFFA